MRLILSLLLLPLSSLATVVTGTIGTPVNGAYPSGSCTISAIALTFSAPNGTQIIGAPTTVSFTAGNYYANLAPTSTTSPVSYYSQNCQVPQQYVGGVQINSYHWGPQYLVVPNSSTPVTLASVTVPTPPNWLAMILPGQVVATGLTTGTYCLNVQSGVVIGLTACSGGAGFTLSTLTNSQLASLTNSQLLALTN